MKSVKISGLLLLIIDVFFVIIFVGCKASRNNEIRLPNYFFQIDPFDVSQFSFKSVNNPSLSSDIQAAIEKCSEFDYWYYGVYGIIEAWVPYGTDITNLVANFAISGKYVMVNGMPQESGKTSNDFSGIVEYHVFAENGDSRLYIVRVNVLPSHEKDITIFTFSGDLNPALVVDYHAGINGADIAVTVPGNSDLASLVATFSSTGYRVLVNGFVQKSGVTVNDFSVPIIYTVEAADGTTKDYYVAVESSFATSKEMISFNLNISDNAVLPHTIQGTINKNNIQLVIPCNVAISSFVPSFTTTGGTVTVDGVEQNSGSIANDFSDTLIYRVTATDGTYIDYSVTVKKTFYNLWSKNLDFTDDDISEISKGFSIKKDSSDNIYVAGIFEGTMDIDPGPGVEEAGPGIYINKYDTAGNLTWIKVISTTNSNIYNLTMAVDPGGNVYLTGHYKNTIDFDPGPGIDSRTNPSAYGEIFITRINSDGSYGWTRTMGNTNSEVSAITVDSAGDVIFAGEYQDTVDFDPSVAVDNRTSAGRKDIFITKLTSGGDYVWTRTLGGSGLERLNAIASDASGGIYFTGLFEESVDFDPGPGEDIHYCNEFYGESAFVTKLNTDGSYCWTRTDDNWKDRIGYSICVDNNNYIFVATRSYSGMDILKLNSDGNECWKRTINTTSASTHLIYSGGIDTDNNGHVYITGYYYATVDFDPSPQEDIYTSFISYTPYASLDYDYYIMQLHDDGSYGSTLVLNSYGDAAVNSITVDSRGFVYVIGKFSNTIRLDPAREEVTFTTTLHYDGFIAGYQFP